MKSAFTSFDRIVGGANAGSAIPWQVSLRNSASGSTHFCGGTILDANTVLSAAHCFHNGHQGVVVVAGSHKRSDNTGVQVIKFHLIKRYHLMGFSFNLFLIYKS